MGPEGPQGIPGPINSGQVIAAPGGLTLTADDNGSILTNEGATSIASFLLPEAAAGLGFTFIVQDDVGLEVVAQDGDSISLGGNIGRIESLTIGASVTLKAVNSSEWFATSIVSSATSWTSYDYFVSTSGDDSNDGLTPETPKRTLTAAAALLTDNKRVGLERGSIFTSDSFIANTFTGIHVGAYGSGNLPVIDCGTVISGWVSHDVPSNTWKKTGVVLISDATSYVTVVEADNLSSPGHLIQRHTSLANAMASALRGIYVTADDGTVDIYLKLPSGSVPTSKVYRYSAQLRAIWLGSQGRVTSIETWQNRHNNGSIELGENSLLEYCTMRNGHKHIALMGFGSTAQYNTFAEGHYHAEPGLMLVVYSPGEIAGLPDTYIEHNTFTCRGLYATPTECIFGHTSGANGGTDIYIRHNTFTDCFGGISASFANIAGDIYFDYNYVTISAGYTTLPYNFPAPYIYGGKYFRFNKFWFPAPFATTFTVCDALLMAGKTVEIDDNEFRTGPYFLYVIAALAGVPVVTARRNIGTVGQTFLHLQGATNEIVECSSNIIGCVNYPVSTVGTTTIGICNYNSWPGANAFRKAGTVYTWAAWVGLGYDTASTYGGDNRIAGRPQGEALEGNLSDWPESWCWISAQETASITQSGGFVSAVADLGPNGRNFILHSPTPSTDKVSLTTVGGKPWFAPVAAGGLKSEATFDTAFPVGLIAIVVRLNAPLSAAATYQTVLSGSPGDNTATMFFGSISVTYTDEIVTFVQQGAGGQAYQHASANYPADVPHLILAHLDPITNTGVLRIDGNLVGPLTDVSRMDPNPLVWVKGDTLMLMRGNTGLPPLLGYLGEVFMAGIVSYDAVAAVEAEMMARWGIT
jgi:hypothetical protein